MTTPESPGFERNFTQEIISITSHFESIIDILTNQLKQEQDQHVRKTLLARIRDAKAERKAALKAISHGGITPAYVFNNCTINGINTGPGSLVMGSGETRGSSGGGGIGITGDRTEANPKEGTDNSPKQKPEDSTERRKLPPVPEELKPALKLLKELMDSEDRKKIFATSEEEKKLFNKATVSEREAARQRLKDGLNDALRGQDTLPYEIKLREEYIIKILQYQREKDPSELQTITNRLIQIQEQLKDIEYEPNQPQPTVPAPAKPQQSQPPQQPSVNLERQTPPPTEDPQTSEVKPVVPKPDAVSHIQPTHFEIKIKTNPFDALATGRKRTLTPNYLRYPNHYTQTLEKQNTPEEVKDFILEVEQESNKQSKYTGKSRDQLTAIESAWGRYYKEKPNDIATQEAIQVLIHLKHRERKIEYLKIILGNFDFKNLECTSYLLNEIRRLITEVLAESKSPQNITDRSFTILINNLFKLFQDYVDKSTQALDARSKGQITEDEKSKISTFISDQIEQTLNLRRTLTEDRFIQGIERNLSTLYRSYFDIKHQKDGKKIQTEMFSELESGGIEKSKVGFEVLIDYYLKPRNYLSFLEELNQQFSKNKDERVLLALYKRFLNAYKTKTISADELIETVNKLDEFHSRDGTYDKLKAEYESAKDEIFSNLLSTINKAIEAETDDKKEGKKSDLLSSITDVTLKDRIEQLLNSGVTHKKTLDYLRSVLPPIEDCISSLRFGDLAQEYERYIRNCGAIGWIPSPLTQLFIPKIKTETEKLQRIQAKFRQLKPTEANLRHLFEEMERSYQILKSIFDFTGYTGNKDFEELLNNFESCFNLIIANNTLKPEETTQFINDFLNYIETSMNDTKFQDPEKTGALTFHRMMLQLITTKPHENLTETDADKIFGSLELISGYYKNNQIHDSIDKQMFVNHIARGCRRYFDMNKNDTAKLTKLKDIVDDFITIIDRSSTDDSLKSELTKLSSEINGKLAKP